MHYTWIAQANKIFLGVLAAQFALGLLIAAYTDTFQIAMLGGLLFASLPFLLVFKAPNAKITRIVVSVAVQFMVALHIQQASGLTEIHFEVFVSLAFLSFYRDWHVILISVLVVAVHHILFFVIQSQGGQLYIFEDGHVKFGILLIHAGFAVVEAAVLMYVAKNSQNEAKAAEKTSFYVQQILSQNGQLNLNVQIDNENDQLKHFNQLIEAFRNLISETKKTSQNALTIAQEVEALSNDVFASSDFNTHEVNSIASAIEQMSVSVADVATRASDANTFATDCSQKSLAAKNIIEQSSGDIKTLNTDLSDAAKTAEDLAQMCAKINDAMSSIKSVAEQTNLLALNAAIESARAGEHGRGFAVVADEVRQLATTTGHNADEISGITAALIDEAKRSVEKIQSCLSKAQSAQESSADASVKMDEIQSVTIELDHNIDSVANATKEQSSASHNIARSAQQLHESTDSQREKMVQSNASVAKLMNNIKNLNNELVKFIV